MTKNTMIIGGAIGLVATTMTIGVAHAQFDTQTRQAIRDAVSNRDYKAFTQAATDTHIAKKITTYDQFLQMSEARELHKAGKHEDARKIAQKLGLGNHDKRWENGKRNGAIGTAIRDNDYVAFQKVSIEEKIAEIITSQALFDKLVTAHKLRASGDHVGARVLLDELGLQQQMRHNNRHQQK